MVRGRAMKISSIVLCSTVFFCVGCGIETRFIPTNTPLVPMHSKPATNVSVFSTAPPNRPYQEVGFIEARERGGKNREDEVFGQLVQVAAEIGCDGLVILGAADVVSGSTFQGTGSVSTQKGYRATCIVWINSDRSTSSATSPTAAGVASTPAQLRCIPGDSHACVGPGGCFGGQVCGQDGAHYEPCDCGGKDKTPPK